MSLSGNLAMGLLRWIKPGKGSFSDLEKLRQRARRENEGFTLRMPRNRSAECVLLPDTALPCMVVRPRHLADPDKAMLAGNAPLYRRAYERGGAGKQLHVTIEGNMIHGYSCMPVFPESRRAYRETVRLIQEL